MNHDLDMIETGSKSKTGTVSAYVLGFILSLILTLCAYFLVVNQVFSPWTLIAVISVLAILQMLVQLIFFLHMGHESKPRWNLQGFLFMALVVIILAGGTLWIMYSLDNRVMPVGNMDTIQQQQM